MQSKLIYQFAAGFLLAAVLSFITVSFLGSHLNYRHELKKEADNLYSESVSIANDYGRNFMAGTLNKYAAATQLAIISSYMDSNIMIISESGNVLLSTYSSAPDEIPQFDPTDTGSKNYLTGDFYGVYDEEQLTVFYPIVYSFSVRGYAVLSKPMSLIQAEANETFNYNYISMLITVAFYGILIILFAISISRPLKKIILTTNRYAKGDFSRKADLHRNDEIGRLSDSLDYMAAEIKNLGDYQKKFIANISHDFRSPLTSIKGYLEAMLDGTIPPEMQEKYLNIVISETERLTKLTNNLLTLNNMNDNGMVLDISDFDIVSVMKQTLETFEGRCSKRHIQFKLVLSDKVLMVNADMQKIQQVIYNLVDNAIKFSNNDSSIILSATENGDKVMISIKDFGIGIPKESISKIWDRFYKTDLSRGKDKKGTGLGLSIVKDIINAHKEYIDVVSTEGVGTEFIFALPKSKPSKTSFITLDD
ncbi:MAG: sensor histidine kinase [Butyrivibrio sp.]